MKSTNVSNMTGDGAIRPTLLQMHPTQSSTGQRTEQAIRPGHLHDGGTGVTNFSPCQAPFYRAAIKAHGDPCMVVAEFDFMDHTHTGLWSLHCITKDKHRDLGAFWSVYDRVLPWHAYCEVERLTKERGELAGALRGLVNIVTHPKATRDDCVMIAKAARALLAKLEK